MPTLSGCSWPEGMAEDVLAVRRGLAKGLKAKLTMDGTGGTYFLRNDNKQEGM